jgi:hypothetical protein
MNSLLMAVASRTIFKARSVLPFLMGEPETPSTFIIISKQDVPLQASVVASPAL